jgi:hypothetical protein
MMCSIAYYGKQMMKDRCRVIGKEGGGCCCRDGEEGRRNAV